MKSVVILSMLLTSIMAHASQATSPLSATETLPPDTCRGLYAIPVVHIKASKDNTSEVKNSHLSISFNYHEHANDPIRNIYFPDHFPADLEKFLTHTLGQDEKTVSDYLSSHGNPDDKTDFGTHIIKIGSDDVAQVIVPKPSVILKGLTDQYAALEASYKKAKNIRAILQQQAIESQKKADDQKNSTQSSEPRLMGTVATTPPQPKSNLLSIEAAIKGLDLPASQLTLAYIKQILEHMGATVKTKGKKHKLHQLNIAYNNQTLSLNTREQPNARQEKLLAFLKNVSS